MKNFKTKVIYRGGSIAIPSTLQKGVIEIKDNYFCIQIKGKSANQSFDLNIPLSRIKHAAPIEKKYYSSVGYFLNVDYINDNGKEESIDMEIRCFIRRGRTQALMNWWAERLSPKT